MSNLLDRIEAGDAKLAIIGMGYVGLPLAIEFARGGLRRKGAEAVYNDPHVPVLRLESGEEMGTVELSEGELERSDCTVVVTEHSAFDWETIRQNCKIVVDTRNALSVCS